jgi:hypothetical protein
MPWVCFKMVTFPFSLPKKQEEFFCAYVVIHFENLVEFLKGKAMQVLGFLKFWPTGISCFHAPTHKTFSSFANYHLNVTVSLQF